MLLSCTVRGCWGYCWWYLNSSNKYNFLGFSYAGSTIQTVTFNIWLCHFRACLENICREKKQKIHVTLNLKFVSSVSLLGWTFRLLLLLSIIIWSILVIIIIAVYYLLILSWRILLRWLFHSDKFWKNSQNSVTELVHHSVISHGAGCDQSRQGQKPHQVKVHSISRGWLSSLQDCAVLYILSGQEPAICLAWISQCVT